MTKDNRTVLVGLIQQNNSEYTDENQQRLAAGIAELASCGADLIVLQELHDSLYFCQVENTDVFNLAQEIPGPATERYAKLAKANHVVLVTSLFEKRAAGIYHNTAVVFDSDGSVAGTYRKMHIPDDPGFYEKFYFTPGDMGFEPIQTSIGRLGVMVCWDQWFPEAARLMAMGGAQMLIYPTAIGWDMGDGKDEQMRQLDAWKTVQRGHGIANGLPVIAVNRVGHESDPSGSSRGIQFWGNSFVAGPQGELVYEASNEEATTALVEVDLTRSESVRQIWPFFRDRRIDFFANLTKRYID